MEEKIMLPFIKNNIQKKQYFFTIATVVAFLCLFQTACTSTPSKENEFKSPSEAVQALVAAVKTGGDKELLAVLGPEAKELISSGDEVYDREARQKFLEAFDERNSIEPDGDNFLLVIGKNDWPYPIPLVKKGAHWVFDTASGKEEILDRRIGKNELDTIQVLLAIVDAQREYAMTDRDGDSLMEYAQKLKSDPGERNGLYWDPQDGEESSPLGQLIANARAEGYASDGDKNNPEPYHGYHYRILTAQGNNASGGAFEYIVDGRMIGGFAVLAFPAEHGNSGVMTFIVNHDGVVYQKDLGENTTEVAKAMILYDPDETWTLAQ
jgi:hypothetical protein